MIRITRSKPDRRCEVCNKPADMTMLGRSITVHVCQDHRDCMLSVVVEVSSEQLRKTWK